MLGFVLGTGNGLLFVLLTYEVANTFVLLSWLRPGLPSVNNTMVLVGIMMCDVM